MPLLGFLGVKYGGVNISNLSSLSSDRRFICWYIFYANWFSGLGGVVTHTYTHHGLYGNPNPNPVVKATSQSNGKGQILTPWGSETPERI